MVECTGVRCPMQYGYKVDGCNHTDCPYRTEPMTNADRIRSMSDEELAIFLERTQEDVAFNNKSKYAFEWEKWLKQPAEVDNG